ncbi:MAG: hypothetical protein IIC11_06960 [Proteobacteria bacterium]|nr:hypothetical protein [Pseudomonadota bacterium]
MKMRNPFRFFTELMQQPIWISLWVVFLMIINVASILFWNEPLAKVIFVTFMLSAIFMMGLYSRFGFEKILGMGHVLWIPLLVYVLMEVQAANDAFKIYLIILSVTFVVSLVFDIVDVWKYFTCRKKNLLTAS